MSLEDRAWSVENEGDSRVSLTRHDDVIHVTRDDDEIVGERWYFDFEPVGDPPISEQFRIKRDTEFWEVVETLIEKHG